MGSQPLATCCGILISLLATFAHASLSHGDDSPRFKVLRQNEDWYSLKNSNRDALPWHQQFKAIPLSTSDSLLGESWLSLGGHARYRVENWSDFNVHPDNDETFHIYRLLLHADLHFEPYLRFFVEGKTAQSTSRDLPGGRRVADLDSLAVQQAFIDLKVPVNDYEFVLRPGRQGLQFGRERLVSPLPWSNTMRTWEGVSLIARSESFWAHAFATQFVPVDKTASNRAEKKKHFHGVYATKRVLAEYLKIAELYWFFSDNDDVNINGTNGDEHRHTLGTRLVGRFSDSPFDYEFEGAIQSGNVGQNSLFAYMMSLAFNYHMPSLWANPKLSLNVDLASGDDKPGGSLQTFNQLYPFSHNYFGFIDIVGRQNLVALKLGLAVTPIEDLIVKIDAHSFWRMDEDDALYSPVGGVLRPPASDELEIGQELDVLLIYKWTKHVMFELGYGHFFPGQFFAKTGRRSGVDFSYFTVQVTF